MHTIRITLIALLVCLLAGCGIVKTAYNNAPALTIWWLDDFFSLSSAQQAQLKPALQNLHKWHRQNQLPTYITQLQSLQNQLANNNFSAADACEKINAIKQNITEIQLESVPIIVEMAPQLTASQLQRFEKKLTERAQKWKDEWWQSSKQAQLEARLEKQQDYAEDIYGDLTDVQIRLLKQQLAQANIKPEISFTEIERRNADALSIVKALQNQSLNLAEKQQLVNDGFAHIQTSPNKDYQTYADALTKHTCDTIANLHATTNAAQKLHAKNWLQNYIHQLSSLQAK